jgi:hypothetical protein
MKFSHALDRELTLIMGADADPVLRKQALWDLMCLFGRCVEECAEVADHGLDRRAQRLDIDLGGGPAPPCPEPLRFVLPLADLSGDSIIAAHSGREVDPVLDFGFKLL